ncbi:hypothetical protein [Acidihalobacter prosperus]
MKRPESRVIPTLDDLVFPGNNSIEPENEPILSPRLDTQDNRPDPASIDLGSKTGLKGRDRLKQEPQFPPLKPSDSQPDHEPGLPPITQLTSQVLDPDHHVPFLADSAHPDLPEEDWLSRNVDTGDGSNHPEAYGPPAGNRAGIDTEKDQPDQADSASNNSDRSTLFKPTQSREPDRSTDQQHPADPRTFQEWGEIQSDTASSDVSLTTDSAGKQSTQELEKLIHKALGDVLEIEIPLLEQRLVKAILKEISKNR